MQKAVNVFWELFDFERLFLSIAKLPFFLIKPTLFMFINKNHCSKTAESHSLFVF